MGGARRRAAVAIGVSVAVVVLWAFTAPAGAGSGTTTFTTSTTHHTTVTHVDLPQIETFATRVTATFGGAVVFDQTADAAPGSSEVAALVAEATATLAGLGAR